MTLLVGDGWSGQVPGGVALHRVDDFPLPEDWCVPNVHGDCPADRSDRVRFALEALHAKHLLDLVEFPTEGGLAFRTIQAWQARLSLSDVVVAVRADDCSALRRQREQRWIRDLDDLQGDHLERYSFENAGMQVLPGSGMAEPLRSMGWQVRPSAMIDPEPPALARILEERSADAEPSTAPPLVSVCVAHHNLGSFLPETLASLAEQTHEPLEVLVIDDGSTESQSRDVFDAMERRHPRFHFLRQTNSGIGATRNRGLHAAKGSFFLPVDADNILRPDMIERLVKGMLGRPELAALSCYFLAFADRSSLDRRRFHHACRPTGGSRVMACVRNVLGDACSLYRTGSLRAVGGYEPDRGTSFEDWEVFVKLLNAGMRIDVLPEHLLYYRHRPEGFSRRTNQHANRERVLRQFRQIDSLPVAERHELWALVAGMHDRLAYLEARQRSRRYRIVDGLHALGGRALHWMGLRKPRSCSQEMIRS